jgi:demethylmenaquinone methyltransferase/2-methoxy-6-polyprenyl-1,4-benzoquinol methylase
MTEAERIYYDRRAAEYDDWYHGTGLYADRARPGWHDERDSLIASVRALPPQSTLDVACGTAFLTRHLRGRVTALDQSRGMLRIARERLPGKCLLQGDALQLPFRPQTFDCLMAAHFYGHLDAPARARFLAEARRVAGRLLVIDAALRDDVQPEEWQERVLQDGSRHTVYKRYFSPAQLVAELGGGQVLRAGRWFVAVLA